MTPGGGWVFLPARQPPGLTVATFTQVTLPFGYGTIWVVNGSLPAAPLFGGTRIWGDPGSFVVGRLNGSPAAVDFWLGLSPGTTIYGAGTGTGRIWAVAGKLVGPSPAGVLSAFATLVSFAGLNYTFIFPSGETFAYSAWQARPNCRFLTTEVVTDPNGIQGQGLSYSLLYWAVVRDSGSS